MLYGSHSGGLAEANFNMLVYSHTISTLMSAFLKLFMTAYTVEPVNQNTQK